MRLTPSILLRSSLVLGAAVLAVGACRLTPPLKQERDSGVVMRLPVGVDRYLGESREPSDMERDQLPSDTGFVKMAYRNTAIDLSRRDQLEVSIVQAGAERRSIHRPEVCLTGQGWSIIGAETHKLEIQPGRHLRVRDLHIERTLHLPSGESRPLRAHYVYWFVGTDVTTPSHFERIWLSSWDSVMRNINHRWAYPSVLGLVTENYTPEEIGQRPRSSDQTQQLVLDLIRHLAPTFQVEFMEQPPYPAALSQTH